MDRLKIDQPLNLAFTADDGSYANMRCNLINVTMPSMSTIDISPLGSRSFTIEPLPERIVLEVLDVSMFQEPEQATRWRMFVDALKGGQDRYYLKR